MCFIDSSGESGFCILPKGSLLRPGLRRIKRNLCINIFKWLRIFGKSSHLRAIDESGNRTRIIPASPADAPFEKVLKPGIAPGTLVVAPRRIENPPLAVRANPRPGFLGVAFNAVFQDRAILLVVFGVNVGFIPAFKALEAFHDRVIRRSDRRSKCSRGMALELRAHQIDIGFGIDETVRGTMQRNKPLAGGNVFEKRLFLFRSDLGVIGVNDQAVVRSERLGASASTRSV